ncbi:hypothetical protein [Endozoicomonas atrinae]|uniref:hypothetical protein n=1 Tax=Endozoicomonas atrinae TaxID=1333660 RepID=UPI0008243F0F|nr:hypothetical protein [Endozoicomonas atrinae]
MALPNSGRLSLADISTEFGGTAPHKLSEYYGSGNVPASGVLKLSDFYGESASTHMWTIGTSVVGGTTYKGFNRDPNVAPDFGDISPRTCNGHTLLTVDLHINTGSLTVFVVGGTPSVGGKTVTLTLPDGKTLQRTLPSSSYVYETAIGELRDFYNSVNDLSGQTVPIDLTIS